MPLKLVRSAKYGAGGDWRDVTIVVNALLRFGDGVPATNGLAGDPAPGIPKILRCELQDGQPVEYAEGETAFWQPVDVAHLIYHICPFSSGRPTWQQNIHLLRRFANWTNGKRIVSIVQGQGCDDINLVLEEFGDFRIDKVITRLNSDAWEMATFPAAIKEVASTASNEAVFYAHAKGVSHQGDELKAATIWTHAMMVFLLGNRERVLEKLGRYATVGSFKEDDGAFDTNWHFSGTFFAIRNDRLFSQPHWNQFLIHRYFIEFYASRIFHSHEAFNLCPIQRPRQWLNIHEWETIESKLKQAEQHWLAPKSADRIDG